jgi:hypothetical protein
MNERIKELAHKADFIGKKNNGAEWRWGYIDPELAEKLEKFAELIVKECCETVERRYKYSNGTPVSFWQMSQDVQDLLKEHFGVEE